MRGLARQGVRIEKRYNRSKIETDNSPFALDQTVAFRSIAPDLFGADEIVDSQSELFRVTDVDSV